MSELSGFPYQEVQFGKRGQVLDAAEVVDLDRVVGEQAVTDLMVLAHGWNNDMAEARTLYANLAARFRQALDGGAADGLPGRAMALAGIFWPSKKIADRDLIPGGAASLGDGVTADALEQQIDGLAGIFDAPDADQALARARGQVALLDDSRRARRTFADEIRGVIGSLDDLDSESRDELPPDFFSIDGDDLLDDLAKPPPIDDAGLGGAAAALGDADGGAAGFGFFGNARAGARNLLNYLTYYQMKKRAGVVGFRGLHPLLQDLRAAHPPLRIHLVGHSFGARLVTAGAQGAEGSARISLDSMTLLQAAFSHNSFSPDWNGRGKPGFFRRVIDESRVRGPIAITHTKNDRAVGLAYPLASRLAGQQAAGVGGPKDRFGGLGRNGAQKTPSASPPGTLLDPAESAGYDFSASRIYNLDADDHIAAHGDVTGPAVVHAIAHAISVT